MIDFQMIEAYDVDIENFNYDVSAMVDSIYIGPQGELLETIESFNHSYGSKIGVTKNFTLKPGGYDEIKQAYNRWVLRYDMKPRGIRSVFDRIDQYTWRGGQFKSAILGIENQMKRLKTGGMRWQDNTDQFEVEYNTLKTSIINSIAETREMYPGISIETKIIPASQGQHQNGRRHYGSDRSCFPSNVFEMDPTDFIIMFYIKIKHANMTVHVVDEEGFGTKQYTLPMDDLYIASGTYLLPLISRHWGSRKPITANPGHVLAYFLEALYVSEMGRSVHPYISRSTDSYYWNFKGPVYSQNICTGNMSGDIRKSLLNNEIMAHIVNLITWVTTYYVPQTYPLNRINMMRVYGDDILFTQWRNDLNSTSSSVFLPQAGDGTPDGCSWPANVHHSILDYARGNLDNYARDNFATDSIEYGLRIEEYVNAIDVAGMPCNNCGFKSECDKWATLQMLYTDDRTCEEEGFVGMLYELWDYTINVRNRDRTDTHRDIPFVELSVKAMNTYSIERSYEILVQTHTMAKWWSLVQGSTVCSNTSSYRRRMRELNNMNTRDRDHLYDTHIVDVKSIEDSKFGWCLDAVQGYRAPQPDDKLDNNYKDKARALIDADNEAIESWLHAEGEDDDLPFGAPDPALTPEQRAIQWAVSRGGAQNL